ncbi:MAG TPA: hypothetical protein VFA94_16895 [Acidimicrobiales bacterium]|nr:hypothetical protein [Acidimicrobiales bacterium]
MVGPLHGVGDAAGDGREDAGVELVAAQQGVALVLEDAARALVGVRGGDQEVGGVDADAPGHPVGHGLVDLGREPAQVDLDDGHLGGVPVLQHEGVGEQAGLDPLVALEGLAVSLGITARLVGHPRVGGEDAQGVSG